MTNFRKLAATFLALICLSSCNSKVDLEAYEQKFSELRDKHHSLQKNFQAKSKLHTTNLIAAQHTLSEMDTLETSLESKRLEVISPREKFANYRNEFRKKRFAPLHQHTFSSLNIAHSGIAEEITIMRMHEGEFYYKSKRNPNKPANDSEGSTPTPEINHLNPNTNFKAQEEHRKEIAALINRRTDLGTSQRLLKVNLSTRREHQKLVTEHANTTSKRTLRDIEALESKINNRSRSIQKKIIVLNSLIQKARAK